MRRDRRRREEVIVREGVSEGVSEWDVLDEFESHK